LKRFCWKKGERRRRRRRNLAKSKESDDAERTELGETWAVVVVEIIDGTKTDELWITGRDRGDEVEQAVRREQSKAVFGCNPCQNGHFDKDLRQRFLPDKLVVVCPESVGAMLLVDVHGAVKILVESLIIRERAEDLTVGETPNPQTVGD